MASILDEIRAEVETELSQQPQEEKPTSVLEDVKQEVAAEPQQAPIEEPKGDFFESAERWLEPAPTQKSSGDIFLGLISNKRSNELDDEDKGLFNALSDEEQYKVAQARKDIPLDDAQARRIFEVEKSKMPSVPTSWEDWYNLGGDAFDVVKNVAKLGVKVPLGAAEFGRDVVKATDMTVSDEEAANNIKKAKGSFYSFMAPAFEIPESVAWATQKASEGGLGWADAAGEKLGLVNPEDRFERWKGRRLVSQAQAEYFREHPTVYSRMLDNPLAKDALSYIAKSQMESPEELAARNNISVEEAKAQQDAMSREQIDNLTSDMESELPEENARVRIAGEFLLPGELGMGTMGAVSAVAKAGTGVAKGLKYIGKSADEIAEINKAAQALRKSQFAEMLKKRTERAEAVAQGAGKIEKAIEGWKPAAEKVNKVFGNITAPVLGGVAGYSVSQESPTTGILTGILGGAATRGLLKGTKVGLEIPTFVREVAEARKVAPLGKTFETLGKSAEGSALKAKILSRGGKTIDNILSNSVEYAKTGIHGTTLALATGALESADPEEMKQMLADGLAITLGGRALQHIKGKMMGNDPIIEQRERISDDSRIHRRYQEADPETQANLDQISDFDNAIAAKQRKLDESESDLANLMAAYKGSAEDAQKIKLAQSEVEKNRIALDQVKRANVQTRNEFGREFLKTYANLQDITNGVLKTGQNNVGFNILSTDQIYQKLRNDPANNNVPDADLAQMASQAGFYSNPAQQGLVFDRRKPSIVINADSIRERINLFGESPTEALNHETSHFIDLVPEFQNALSGVRSMLFQNEIRDAAGNIKATTPGIFSKLKLVELFNDGYLRHLDPQGKEAFSKLNKLWDESRGQLDENKVANYMKSELMADLLGEVSSRHLSNDLDSATLAMWDRARIKAKKNLLDRAIDRFYGFGGRGDIVTAANTRAEFPPEAMAAARDAMRQIVALNGEISPPVQEPDMPAISKAQMMKNSALLNRFGKDSPLFKSEFKVKVFDKDGNQIGESMPVTTPNPREGTFQSTDVGMRKLSGYGDIPVEAQGLQVPEGGTLVVSRDLVMQPDGVTPVMYDAKEAKKVAAERKKLITEALDTDDYGTPNRFEPVAEGSETYRGTFTPAQIKAIQDMPESLVPKTLKENMLKVNEAIARGDGTRFIVDYAAVMNDNGKYQAFSPKMYDLVPIGMHLSKAGNFLVTTISVGRIFDKMRLWNERMPGRLRFWDNNLERTFDDFSKYLNNWQQGKAGETGLDADPQVALQKKNIFNDLLSLYDKATEYTNVDRTTIPRRKGDPRGKDPNRTIMSIRVDHIAELLANENATKLPVNYGFAKINFMPERMEGEVPRQEKRQIDENVKFANPPSEKSAIDALSSNKRQYFGMHRGLDDGYPVGIRIDIPAFTSKGVYVVTVHEKKKGGERGQVGERIGYDTIAKVDNPIFFSNEVGAKKIKSGEANKFPVATVEGQFNSSREIPEDINEWTPVGYNPREHSYFYDKTNDEPVLSGDEAISVGNTVFVKNPVYGDKANFAFMPERPAEQERIVSATYTDPRTGEVREGVNHKAANPNAPDEQTDRESRYYGFKTDTGRVVDREEAYRIAEESGQLKEATSEEDKFNSDRGVLHSNMVEMEPTIGEKTEISPKIDTEKLKISIDQPFDEFGDIDYDAEDAVRKIAKDRNLGITSDRELAFVAKDENGEIVGGAFTSADQDGYTFDVVVSKEAEGKGVGSKLLDEVINPPYEIAEAYPDAQVKVDVVNPSMKKMLENRGFVVEEKIGKERWIMVPQKPTISEKQKSSEMIGADTIKPADIETSAKPATDAVIKPYSNALVSSAGLINFLPAYHGTPHEIPIEEGFKMSQVGTGEGAQAYGHGLYFAQAKGVAEGYRKMLSKGVIPTLDKQLPEIGNHISQEAFSFLKGYEDIDSAIKGLRDTANNAPEYIKKAWEGREDKLNELNKKYNEAADWIESNKDRLELNRSEGNLYKVDIDVKDEDLLDWDKPLSEQPESVRDALTSIVKERVPKEIADVFLSNAEAKGGSLYALISDSFGESAQGTPEKRASEALLAAGIPGIRYLDGMSRGAGAGTYNYVVFDENLIKILDKNDKPVEGDLPKQAQPSGLQFMPQRPVGKTEPLPDFETTIIKGVTPRKGFNWKKATNVEFDIGGGKKMSFSYDPQLLTEPVFKDLIKELKGQPVILLEADRQRATGGDMGGPLHPFLKSNQVTITGPDGKKYKAVWANMTSGFVSGAKNRLASHGAKYALVHLMDSIAHKSNKRTARTLDKMMRDANLNQREKEIVSLSMQAGIIAGEKAAMGASITALKRQITQAKGNQEKIQIINEKINKIKQERDDITPKGIYGEIFNVVSGIKTAHSNVKTGLWKESSIEKANKKLEDYVKLKEYKELLKNNKSLYISDNIGNTFSNRGSAIGSILSFKFGKFDPSYVMRESSDFKEGENLDIVTAVELSQNPDIFALYFGNDPKEEAAMSTAERKARDEMRANPDFVEHEAYDWVMLGPEKGNNFLVEKPVKPEEIFKKYRETHAGKSVVEGSDETVVGAMRKNAGFILRVDEDTQKVVDSKKKKNK
jgi:ribosomal protein S18 acetylase RimI-like enzyme